MIISKLKKEDYQGKKFIARYMAKGYYDIQRSGIGKNCISKLMV